MQPRIIQVVALAGCGALVIAASTLTTSINEGRKSLDMYGVESPTESAPPEYAFAIQAFGAFRGLVTNIAFIRAEEYKRQGRYYDAMQLAEWICKLQPRFPSVWEFHSWNMAWNISVTTYTPQERWNWVYNGAKLIRDEGLKYNPRAVNLYRQLAWIFVNKMSETTDEYHLTYKRQWAYRMHLVLGAPPDPLGEYRPDQPFEALDQGIGEDLLTDVARREKERRAARDRRNEPNSPEKWEDPNVPPAPELERSRSLHYEIAKKAFYQWMREIADAPRTLHELHEVQPETRELVRQLRDLGVIITDDQLTEDEYWREEGLAFTFFQRYRQLDEPGALLARIRTENEELGADEEAEALRRFDEIMRVRQQPPATQALLRFLQRKVLLEVYKLDPEKMARLIKIFGPMDWRVVDAHSLYWVNEGLIAGQETISKFGNDKINTARLIFFSLRNLYLRNRIVFEPYHDDINYSYLNFNPDLNFVESMHRAYLDYGKLLDPDPQEGGVGGSFRSGHQNFLTDAVCMLYFAGREREARRYFEYLRENYSRSSLGDFNPAFAKSLRDFVMDNYLENIDGYWERRAAISQLLVRSFNELMQGNLAHYNGLVTKAIDLHAKHNREHTTGESTKLRLPPFRDYQADVLRAWLGQPSVSPTMTVNKARLWRMLPLYLKHAVYDDLRELFEEECQAMGFDAGKAFPEPEGMEQYRQERERRGPEPEADDVETPAQPAG
jgi:hypothetical protein